MKTKFILLGASILTLGLQMTSAKESPYVDDYSVLCVSNSNSLFREQVNKVNSEDAKAEITEVLNLHFRGIKEGNVELLNEAWIKDNARLFEVNNGKVVNRDIVQAFAKWTKEATPDLNEKILDIYLSSDAVAIAKVSLMWQGVKYEDSLTLVKSKKGWKIVSKIYSPKIEKEQKTKKVKISGYH
jgi:hypothetical protein